MKPRTLTYLIVAVLLVAANQTIADWTTPILVDGINTAIQESGPGLSNDNLTIYFCRYTDYWRLYQATRSTIDDPFTSVTQISELNGSHNTSYAWISQDGLRMYYTQNRRLRIATRTSVSDIWTPGPYLSELNSYGNNNLEDCHLSTDECTIVFATVAGNGKWDMNIAFKSDTTVPFGNIRALSELNTSDHDNGASLTANGLTIYFASDRSGDWQIYKAKRLSVDDPFGTPEKIPSLAGFCQPTVNMDGHIMLFVSPGSNWDIYVSYSLPVADAGDDQLVYAGLDGMATVTLDGSGSNDPQNNPLVYTWSYIVDGNELTASGVNPQIMLPVGIHTITLIVNDGQYDSEPDEIVVEVVGPLKVDMKLWPVFPRPPSGMLLAEFAFPAHLNEQLDPYLIALAADPNATVDYFDLSVYGDTIRRCNVGFMMNKMPASLLQPGANIMIFGSFKSGQLFYGEDTLRKINPSLHR